MRVDTSWRETEDKAGPGVEGVSRKQPSTEPVDVRDWDKDEKHPYYPVGSREKDLLVCPEDCEHEFCIPLHRYLYKKSFHRHSDHFWTEIVAYRIGCIIGVNVPPAYVAFNSENNECAALIEWFTDYPDEKEERFVHGGDTMQRIIKDFDRVKGKQHNFEAVSAFFRVLNLETSLKDDWIRFWSEAFTFDALIGNTDRHQDNWGWLVHLEGEVIHSRIAPLFDNGTSLGYEILPQDYNKFEQHEKLKNYIKRGTHHMKWSLDDFRKTNHADMLIKFCDKFPSYKFHIQRLLDFDLHQVRDLLYDLTRFDLPVPFTSDRAEFILRLISRRKEFLTTQLNNQ